MQKVRISENDLRLLRAAQGAFLRMAMIQSRPEARFTINVISIFDDDVMQMTKLPAEVPQTELNLVPVADLLQMERDSQEEEYKRVRDHAAKLKGGDK